VLAEWDVIQPEDGGYRMRVEMLRQWIAERKPLSRVRDEMDRILPAAENLFQAAYSIYQGGQLDDAEPLLRQSVRLNPNHLKANQLLAEILIAKGKTDEALKILETLYEYNPCDVKHRLVQVLLNKAKETKEENEQLSIYERILKIEPNLLEAIDMYRKYYKRQADVAFKNHDLDKALDIYKKAHVLEPENFQPQFIQALLNQAKMEKDEKNRITFYEKVLELEPNHTEVLNVYKKICENQGDAAYQNNDLDKALELFKKVNSIEKIEKVNKKLKLGNIYQQALNALENNEREEAQKLLVEILSIDPLFKDAIGYMYLSVTGLDVNDLKEENKKLGIAIMVLLISLLVIFLSIFVYFFFR
jgi:tetratricopeptide (TPR) repeat protein